MTRIEAPARLHFGLLSLPIAGEMNPPQRQFGGIGLMIDKPSVALRVEAASDWSASGPGADRALEFARRITATLPVPEQYAFAIQIDVCPEEHSGLGSGTALALAVAKAIACEAGHADWPAAELARRTGRGERSAIGVHGFELGGFIVEAGKRPGEFLAPLVGRYEFPGEWRIVLASPAGAARWHGSRERQAFTRLTRNNATGALCQLALTGLLPALIERDLDAFGDALHEFNALAGAAFMEEQGGCYADPAVANLINRLRQEGIRGVGQTSWGPTVFAVVADDAQALRLEEHLARCAIAGPMAIWIVRAAAGGASATRAD